MHGAHARGLAAILPCVAGEGNRPQGGGGGGLIRSPLTPSAMLRMVPLPRFTGEDEGETSDCFIHQDAPPLAHDTR